MEYTNKHSFCAAEKVFCLLHEVYCNTVHVHTYTVTVLCPQTFLLAVELLRYVVGGFSEQQQQHRLGRAELTSLVEKVPWESACRGRVLYSVHSNHLAMSSLVCNECK